MLSLKRKMIIVFDYRSILMDLVYCLQGCIRISNAILNEF